MGGICSEDKMESWPLLPNCQAKYPPPTAIMRIKKIKVVLFMRRQKSQLRRGEKSIFLLIQHTTL
jgi:hypothetical protein